MALLSFHCQNYKAGALTGIDGHNRRLHKNHKSNPDIDNERSANNVVYVAPKKNLYADCKALIKEKVIDTGHRVRKDSNWICESIFSYPEELPPDRMNEYFELIIKYVGARLGKENIVEAVAHCDEGGLSAIEYKKQMENEAKEISNKIDDMIKEHNRLVELIQRLKEIALQLEHGNLSKARDIVARNQRTR